MKFPCPNSNSMKIKTMFQSHIFPHLWPLIQGLAKAKSMVRALLNKEKYKNNKWRRNNKNKLYDSIRLHYNWCSSHVLPMPEMLRDGFDESHVYYDSTWNSIIPSEESGKKDMEQQLSGYLHWLEEKHAGNSTEVAFDEIDRLADMFIASCHEKFRLEKQESYRSYQEMMARSV